MRVKIFVCLLLWHCCLSAQNKFWQPTADLNKEVFAVAINDNMDYFAGGRGLYSTVDFKFWQINNIPGLRYQFINSIASFKNNLYVGTESGLYHSTGSGWTDISNGLVRKSITLVTVDSLGTLFAVCSGDGLYQTSDNGGNWKLSDASLPARGGAATFLSTDARGHLYIAPDGRDVFRSKDGGKSWQKVYTQSIPAVTYYATANSLGHLFVGFSTGEMLFSENDGQTWQNVPLSFGANKIIYSIAAVDDNSLLVGTLGNGLFLIKRSEWRIENHFLPSIRIWDMKRVSLSKSVFHYLLATSDGVYLSDSQSRLEPQKVGTGYGFPNIYPVYGDANGYVYGLSTEQKCIYVSKDDGAGWNRTKEIPTRSGFGLALRFVVTPKGTMVVGTSYDGLLLSVDSGNKWTKWDANPESPEWDEGHMVYALGLDSSGNILSAWGDQSLHYSEDEGLTWKKSSYSIPEIAQKILTDNHGRLYATSKYSVYIAAQRDSNWIKCETNLSGNNQISDIAVDDNGHIYLSVNSKGLLVSRDGGSSWNELSLPVDANPLFFYSISKGSDGRLYSIYSNKQVFAYDNWDGQWTEISEGLEGPLGSKPAIMQLLPSASGYVYALTPYYIARSIEKSVTRVVSQRTQDRADDFALAQNYPNPFNAGTVISYHCPGKNHVTLKIYNLLGREVDTLVAEIQEAGRHSVKWQAGEFPSGLYFYTLQIGSQVERKKMLLVK